jgi:hypothetical protein
MVQVSTIEISDFNVEKDRMQVLHFYIFKYKCLILKVSVQKNEKKPSKRLKALGRLLI